MTATDVFEFETSFKGAIVRPGHERYDELRKVFNGMVDRHPAMFARCQSTADVQAALNHARGAGLPVSVYCGGHGATGHAVSYSGMCIRLRGRRSGTDHAATETARI